MANDVLIVSAAPQVYVRYLARVNWQSSQVDNYSNITVDCYALVRNGSRYGGWDWNAQVSGSNGGSKTQTFSGDVYMGSRTVNVGHDANGNLSVGVAAWLDVYYGSGTASGTLTAARIPLAPTITEVTADTIQSTSVRLGMDLSSHGHGSSSTNKMQYRLQGATTWIDTANQANVSGADNNYWTVTGLEPSKVYEYRAVSWNNYNDTATGTTYTFTTLASGIINIIAEIMQ